MTRGNRLTGGERLQGQCLRTTLDDGRSFAIFCTKPVSHFWYCCAMVQKMAQKLVVAGIFLLALSSPAIAGDFQRPAPVHLDHDGEKWAQKTLKKLSLEEKVGQMFMIRLAMPQFVNLRNPEYLNWLDQIRALSSGLCPAYRAGRRPIAFEERAL